MIAPPRWTNLLFSRRSKGGLAGLDVAGQDPREVLNIMPVIALWTPYNVPIQKSTDSTNTYEVCFLNTHPAQQCRLHPQ